MALRPRRTWTNRLAWSVWNIRNKNRERQGGVVPPPIEYDYVYYLTGAGAWTTQTKIIPDPVNQDFGVGFRLYKPIDTVNASIYSQTTQGNNLFQEFRILLNPDVRFILGGEVTLTGYTMLADVDYRLEIVGTTWTLFEDNIQVATNTFTRGAVQDPNAVSIIGARGGDPFPVFSIPYESGLSDIHIYPLNGTVFNEARFPMNTPAPTLPDDFGGPDLFMIGTYNADRWVLRSGQALRYVTNGNGFDDYLTIPSVFVNTSTTDINLKFNFISKIPEYFWFCELLSTSRRIAIFNNLLFINGTTFPLSDTLWSGDSQQHSAEIDITAGALTFTVDGDIKASGAFTGTVGIDALYAVYAGTTSIPWYNGSIYDLDITIDGVQERFYPIDEPFGVNPVYDTVNEQDGARVNVQDSDMEIIDTTPTSLSQINTLQDYYVTNLNGSSHLQLPALNLDTTVNNIEIRAQIKTNNTSFHILADSTGSFRVAIFNNNMYIGTSPTTLSNTAWLGDSQEHSIIFNVTNEVARLYIDESLVAELAVPGLIIDINSAGDQYGNSTSIPLLNGYLRNIEIDVNDSPLHRFAVNEQNETDPIIDALGNGNGSRVGVLNSDMELIQV